MGTALPFSEIDVFLENTDASSGCIADTNLLIAITDSEHTFHEDAAFLVERLSHHEIPIYVSVTARSEFVDYQRRVILTESLMDMLAPSSPWKISAAVRAELKSQQGWLNTELGKGHDAILTDQRLKDSKKAFLPRDQSGQIGWVRLCKEFLAGKLLAQWTYVSEELGLKYIDMRSEDTKNVFRKALLWEDMYRLSEETGVGSNDAMILNVLDSSIFQFAVTADYDLAYGAVVSVKNKTVLVPDALYRRHLKKLRV